MSRLIVAWYGWLSGLTQGLVLGLQDLADSIALPAAAAVSFGLIGATSPDFIYTECTETCPTQSSTLGDGVLVALVATAGAFAVPQRALVRTTIAFPLRCGRRDRAGAADRRRVGDGPRPRSMGLRPEPTGPSRGSRPNPSGPAAYRPLADGLLVHREVGGA